MAFSELYVAASQSGKSTLIRSRLREARAIPRWLVWDFKREYGAEVGELVPAVKAIPELLMAGRARLVYRPPFDAKARDADFGLFCRIALASARGGVETLLVVEELGFVTTPQLAPEYWMQATCTGLGLGLSVIGSSQYPAQIDKAFFGNTTAIYCGRLVEEEHVRKMARLFMVEPARIATLPPFKFLLRRIENPAAIAEVSAKKLRGKPL